MDKNAKSKRDHQQKTLILGDTTCQEINFLPARTTWKIVQINEVVYGNGFFADLKSRYIFFACGE